MRQALSQHLFKHVVSALALISSFAAIAEPRAATEKLNWVKNDAPPFYITGAGGQEGSTDEQGFGDRIQALIERALNNYQHETLRVPLSRLSSSWKAYNPLCFATMIHEAPLSDDYLLSVPNAMYLPHGIITTNEFAESLPILDDGSVSLESIIREQKISMGHISGRTYGEKLDRMLRLYRHNIEINARAGSTETQGILTMLTEGRFDFIIDYEFVLNHYVDSAEQTEQLRFLPINETRGNFILGAVGCTNSEEGQKAIQSINKAMPGIVHSRPYRRAVAAWLVPVGDEAHYWIKFDDVLRDHLGLPIQPSKTARHPFAASEDANIANGATLAL